jgi:hypothetical protein
VTDGPYAESKEVLGGFILIEARDMEEAVRIAENIPVGKFASIEVRPEMKIGLNVGCSRCRTRKMHQDEARIARLGIEAAWMLVMMLR